MLVQQEEDVYLNFVNSIKSDVTKRIYEYNLKLFMEFCGIDKFEDLIGQQDKIIIYLMSLREKKLSFNSISTRLNAIYHFYDMNDVSLNKKKIKMFKGESQRKVVDRAYMHEDIKKILDVSDLRAKTISENERIDPDDRLNALNTMNDARLSIVQLLRDGPQYIEIDEQKEQKLNIEYTALKNKLDYNQVRRTLDEYFQRNNTIKMQKD